MTTNATPQEILSEIIVFSKYAKYLKEKKRRENWEELVTRNQLMHMEKYPDAHKLIHKAYQYVFDKKVLPSMRSLQFAGFSIFRNESRIYNCAFMPIESPLAFPELTFLLLGGTGVGYSVQNHHVYKLPLVKEPRGDMKHLVADTIEGWADSVKALCNSYFYSTQKPRFDYSDVRPAGTPLLTTGGRAPGYKPLMEMLQNVDGVLKGALGRRLRPVEVHDICCFIADAVLVAGIRRAALISLFSPLDEEMLFCKSGSWWEDNPQRARANNSACLLRGEDEHLFPRIWEAVTNSGSGEPGIYWTNNRDYGTNPCGEIALRPYTFCNLVEVNAQGIIDKEDFIERCEAATTIATLQAGYTDFHYLRGAWRTNTREDALIGVGITGIANNRISHSWLPLAAERVIEVNRDVAALIGINPAARTTTIKPSGTSSLVLGSSSGIHAWHAPYFIRRIRYPKTEAIAKYMALEFPELTEDCKFSPDTTLILSIPQKAPEGALNRFESTFDLLDRILTYNKDWVHKGHNRGDNFNNVSATISVRDGEWEELGKRLFEERNNYNGISVLPYDGGTYIQAPLEDTDKETYERLEKFLHNINLELIIEEDDNTSLMGEAACAAGSCDIPM